MNRINIIVRMGLFILIVSLGTMAALVVDETNSLALANLSDGSVQAMATDAQGDTLYAVLANGSLPSGIYRSLDSGQTWQLASSGPGVSVNALALHPTDNERLYAGTNGGSASGLWHSRDGGVTWAGAAPILPRSAYGQYPTVTALAVDPRQPDALYVGTDGQGVYQLFPSQSGVYPPKIVGGEALNNAHVKSLVVAPGGPLYALTQEGLFTTADGIWQKLTTPELPLNLVIAPTRPQILYVGTASTGVYRSDDDGQSWERLSDGLEFIPGAALRITALAVDEQNPNHIVAATAYSIGGQLAPEGIYEINDAGQPWIKRTEAKALVSQLTLKNGTIQAATTNGLAYYGGANITEPTPQPALTFVSSRLRSLAHPSGIQVLILILTVTLAGLVAVGRMEWVLKRYHFTTS